MLEELKKELDVIIGFFFNLCLLKDYMDRELILFIGIEILFFIFEGFLLFVFI